MLKLFQNSSKEMMKRPLCLRFGPALLRKSIFAGLYRARRDRWLPLYQSASLAHAPQVQMELVAGDIVSDVIAFTGIYEPHLTRRVLELGRRGGTMVDIGANLGYFSLLWAAAKPTNRCIAFEPSPRNTAILKRNISRNGFDERIEVIASAAGAKAGKFLFDPGPEEQCGWGGLTNAARPGSFEVDVVRVDDMIPRDQPISLLKVDTEGADAWALIGCDRLLRAGLVEEIWYEQNKVRSDALGISRTAAQDYLQSVGYRCTPKGSLNSGLVEWIAVRA
jgi:FkbM family methyltransferase